MEIISKQARQEYLVNNIKGVGSYALVTYNNHTEAIWFVNMGTSFSQDGSIWFLEAPCCLLKHEWDTDNPFDLMYIKEQGYLIKNDNVYEIESPQVAPFLPDKLNDLTLISEDYCLEWLLNKSK